MKRSLRSWLWRVPLDQEFDEEIALHIEMRTRELIAEGLAPDEARAVAVVEGEQVASIGDNRKMLIFPLEQLPEMARGSGVRLQRYKDGGLSDVKTFKGADGLTWTDGAGREFSLTLKELSDWRGNRADAGRLPPKGFPRSNKFR